MKTKLKSRKTALKRFTQSASGKLMRLKTGAHKATRKKSPGRQRNLLRGGEVSRGDMKRMSRMMGEGH
jgi:ribosomal protein L35